MCFLGDGSVHVSRFFQSLSHTALGGLAGFGMSSKFRKSSLFYLTGGNNKFSSNGVGYGESRVFGPLTGRCGNRWQQVWQQQHKQGFGPL